MSASRVLGRSQEFDPQKEDIASYLERLQLYFEANEVAEEKRVSVLLTIIRGPVYCTLRNLVAPVKPKGKTFNELLATLQKHYDPKPLVIAERYRFYKRCQTASESVTEFLAELRHLSIRCDFGEFLEQALRDRFVVGIRSESAQKRLLAIANLTLTRALEEAQSMEAADKDSRELKGGASDQTTSSRENLHYTGAP